MHKKVLTKDCPSCKLMVIDEKSQFTCNWGIAKKVKILDNPKSATKPCKLLKEKK